MAPENSLAYSMVHYKLSASVIKVSLLPSLLWSTLSSGVNVIDDSLTTPVTSHTTSWADELGRGNTDKLTMMTERNDLNGRIVSIASEKYAISKELINQNWFLCFVRV